MKLPNDWKAVMSDPLCQVGALLQGEKPLFIVKLPDKVGFNDIAVAFGAINFYEYLVEGHIISLRIILQDLLMHTLETECLLNPDDSYDQNFLSKLKLSSNVHVAAVDQNLHLLGVKQLSWSTTKQQRINDILQLKGKAKIKRKSSTSQERNWNQARKKYYAGHSPTKGVLVDVSNKFSSIELYGIRRTFNTQQLFQSEKMIDILPLMNIIEASVQSSIIQARKYRLAPSSIVMIDYFKHIDTPFKNPPNHPIWIEVEHPIFISHTLPRTKGAFWYPIFFQSDVQKPEQYRYFYQTWLLDLFDEQGRIHSTYYYSSERGWTFPLGYNCPSKECKNVQVFGHSYITTQGCTLCKQKQEQAVIWFIATILVTSGFFAEREDSKEIEEVIEKVVHPLPPSQDIPQKSQGKISKLEHRYTIVRFDASVQKIRYNREQTHSKDSWVKEALAVNPDAVLYVDRYIGQTRRSLQHERFTHKRGQTITVRPHEKRIPMKVSEIESKMLHVFASEHKL